MNKQLIITGLITLTGIFILIPHAFAQAPSCNMIYGGGQTCQTHPNISVNKQILEPATKQYRENLTAKSNYFSTNEQITFKIIVKNTSDKTLKNITVNDVIPASLTYRSGNGKYDKATRRFSETINELAKGQEKTFTINTTVNSINNSNVCVANQVMIMQDRQTGTDNTTFCINGNSKTTKVLSGSTNKTGGSTNTTKGGLPIYGQPNQKQTPQTGPELLGILSLPAIGGFGIYLNKYSRRFNK